LAGGACGDGDEAVGIAPAADPGFLQRYGGTIEYILIPGAALVGALAVFGIFVAVFGKNPLDLYFYMYQGAFGTWFSWQNTLTRAAPLILTALCTALPAQLGMVIIGGEGALLIGAGPFINSHSESLARHRPRLSPR
jgi:simple sugar transport system permease protein